MSWSEICVVAETAGLAAGLRQALATGTAVPCSAGGRTLIPADSIGGVAGWQLAGSAPDAVLTPDQVTVEVLAHPLAATEELALVRISPHRSAWSARSATGVPPAAVLRAGLLLAAVRVGLSTRMLRLAAGYLSTRLVDGEPLTHKQLVQGGLADAAGTLELCRLGLATARGPVAVEALHDQLTSADWSITTMFGGSGYLREHSVRCLYVAALVRDAWAVTA